MSDEQPSVVVDDERLFADVSRLVSGARERVTQTVNQELTLLHWQVGARVRSEILNYTRAEYGERVIASLAERLTNDFGRGWSRRKLFKLVAFAEAYPDPQIVQTLSAQLTWSHFDVLLGTHDDNERRLYTTLCRRNHWTVRQLREQIRTQLHSRLASGEPDDDEILERLDSLPTGVGATVESTFKDPYVLDFLNLPMRHSESQLESAILDELERFLVELGGEFCFVARQKRMRVGRSTYALDLLFYHRGIQRLVAIDLKLGSLAPEHKGQMELYLRWLDREMRLPHEDKPIGLILCTGSDPSLIELLSMNSDDIHVSTYLTQRLPMAALKAHVSAVVETHGPDS